MPITTLQIPKEGKEILLVFQTDEAIHSLEDELGNKLCVKIYQANKLLQPQGKPDYEYFNQSEEDFHKTIRRAAADEKHLITTLSTDPDWNPEGYIKELKEDESKKES